MLCNLCRRHFVSYRFHHTVFGTLVLKQENIGPDGMAIDDLDGLPA